MAIPSFEEGTYHMFSFMGGTLFIPIFGTLLHSRRHTLLAQAVKAQMPTFLSCFLNV